MENDNRNFPRDLTGKISLKKRHNFNGKGAFVHLNEQLEKFKGKSEKFSTDIQDLRKTLQGNLVDI